MLQYIIAFSIRQKFITGLMVLLLVITGLWQLTQLSIDAVPDITNNQVQVITQAPALGATDIERLVTFPVEQACSNIPGLLELRSFSRFGLSLVTLVFTDETDVYWARQQVSERLQEVKDKIPAGMAESYLAPVTTGLGEIYQYTLRPAKGYETNYSLSDLRTIQDWIVRRELLRVEGVADVSSFGGNVRQIEVSILPDKLASRGINLQEIVDALETNNQNTGGAYIEKSHDVLYIRTEGLFTTIQEIENITVRLSSEGVPIPLRELAVVKEGHAIRYGSMTYNGEQEVAGAIVMMMKGGNSSKTVELVKKRVEEIQKILPPGIIIQPFLDRTKMVNNSISTVTKNLAEGALIVVFVLVLFLGNFRAGLIVASVIPLSMLFAVILMNLTGVSGNLMSLGALDFGLIVDGAVIIVEAVLHKLSHHPGARNKLKLKGSEMDTIVEQTAGPMMNSAVFGQIIILIVYLPIFTLQGIEGKMFQPMALTVAFALIGAFILSLTWIPMMSSLALPKKLKINADFSARWLSKIESIYLLSLKFALRNPIKIIISVGILSVLTFGAMTRLGGEFIPALEEGDFAIETRVLTGNSLSLSTEVCLKGEKILLEKFPEVIQVVGKTGSSEIPIDPMPVEASDLIVILKDKSEWTSAKTFPELAEKMKEALSELPGVSFGFQYPVQMRFNELMTGARQDVVCKIFGEDLDTLTKYAHQLGKIVSGTEGCVDLYIESITGMPELVVQFNREAMASYGVSVEKVNTALRMAYAGQGAGWVYEGEKRFELVVRMEDAVRQNPDAMSNLMIPVKSGQSIPLSVLANIKIQEGPNQIQREDARRRIVTGFNIRGVDVQTVVAEIQKKVEKEITLPPGYRIQYGGSFENLEKAKSRLLLAVPASLLMILLLLYFAFYSVRQAILIFTAVPLSAIGGILGLYFRDMPFSISAGVGFIALFGVAVLNGIVLMAEFNRRKKLPGSKLSSVVLGGSKTRLRPVLMTAMVASLGFLPMALSTGAGAEVQKPLATVVIGGLLLATFLTLFLLPILFAWSERGYFTRKLLALVFIPMIFIPQIVSAQTIISYNDALILAKSTNQELSNAQSDIEYRHALIKSGSTIPRLDIEAEYGQLNSIYSDRRVSIAQTFDYPGVYTQQRNILENEHRQMQTIKIGKEADLIRELKWVFMEYFFLTQRRDLLNTTDSIIRNSLKLAALRLKLGETDALELTAIQTQQSIVLNQLQDLENQEVSIRLKLSLLLNSAEKFVPAVEDVSGVTVPAALLSIENHPSIQLQELNSRLSLTQISLERMRRMPEFSIGFAGMSMYGMGANEMFYNYSRVFQSIQLGIAIPIWGNVHSSKIAAAKINRETTIRRMNFERQKIQWEYESLLARRQLLLKQQEQLEKMQNSSLKQESDILSLRMQKGDLSILEWNYLIQQQLSIRLEYWRVKEQLAQVTILISSYNFN